MPKLHNRNLEDRHEKCGCCSTPGVATDSTSGGQPTYVAANGRQTPLAFGYKALVMCGAAGAYVCHLCYTASEYRTKAQLVLI